MVFGNEESTGQGDAVDVAGEDEFSGERSAASEHLLGDPGLGFPAAAAVLTRLLGGRNLPFEAAQLAVARYTRVAFEAPAVTAVAVAVSARRGAAGVLRSAELHFGHPYAVVAVATGDGNDRRGRGEPGPWHGLRGSPRGSAHPRTPPTPAPAEDPTPRHHIPHPRPGWTRPIRTRAATDGAAFPAPARLTAAQARAQLGAPLRQQLTAAPPPGRAVMLSP